MEIAPFCESDDLLMNKTENANQSLKRLAGRILFIIYLLLLFIN